MVMMLGLSMYMGVNCYFIARKQDTVAEWLRRRTWNPLGLSRVGSNPASVVLIAAFATMVVPDTIRQLRYVLTILRVTFILN